MPRKHTALPYGLHPSACGGVLRNRARGRGARKISVRFSMHLVLRSTQARGAWSFVRPGNRAMVTRVLGKHAATTGVQLLGVGNAGNHLHLRVKVATRKQYMHFIRAVAGEIALRLKRIPHHAGTIRRNFWDRRPFSSIVSNNQYIARLADYLKINELEGHGHTRAFARLVVQKWRPGETRRGDPAPE